MARIPCKDPVEQSTRGSPLKSPNAYIWCCFGGGLSIYRCLQKRDASIYSLWKALIVGFLSGKFSS